MNSVRKRCSSFVLDSPNSENSLCGRGYSQLRNIQWSRNAITRLAYLCVNLRSLFVSRQRVAGPEEAIDLVQQAKGICSEGAIRLHKFVSNSKTVMQSIAPEDLASGTQDLNLLKGDNHIERVLGMQWCIEIDKFIFRITLQDQPCTRRGILSTVNFVYDPLGLLAPVTLKGKMILQEMCRDQLDWDSPLPDRLKAEWNKWRFSLFKLQALEIPRCFKPDGFGNVERIEMHHFSDASSYGYGQCSYLRLVNDKGQVHCT